MTSMIGRTIGGYYVEQLLGTGGMGEVYRGYNVHTKHPVAIKIINAKWTADSSIKARFVREAKIVAQLDHPHIVRMRHFDEVDGCLYLVMDFVTDGSLRSLLARYKAKKQPFPLDVGLDLARQSTDALFYAHTQGVIHRDVKPENILLQPESSPSSTLPPYVVKLSDFGLARIAETGSFLTVPGMVMGTPAYMSPEQCLGKTVDERADIYALGVVLYEMTTGYLPFNGSLEKLFEQHLNVPPQPLRTIRTDLPEQIEAIVLRCLAKDPEDRFTSAAALSQALTDARASLSAPIPLQETFSGTTAPSQTRQIGNYFVESEHPIGSGGMGQVFRARDLRDSRQVALKIIYDNLAANPKVRERFFKRELSIAQRLRHPNIVEVFDGGEDGRQLFLAMEWMADGSLRTLLDQRTVTPLPLILGLALVAQAADALAYAHSQGVVHRDIKPENLLLRKETPSVADQNLLTNLLGQTNPIPMAERYTVKLNDFGVAALADGTRLTTTGRQPGTHAYMSPEQCKGLPVDGRCDVYALGVILYEMATGTLPFTIETPESAFYKILCETPQLPRTLNPDLPPAIEAIIVRCLEKTPDDRFQSASNLAVALRAALGSTASAMNIPAQQPSVQRASADYILVSIDKGILQLTPGQTTTTSVTIANLGHYVDHFEVSIEGAPSEWIAPATHTIQLNPNQIGTVTFSVTVPATPDSRPGEYEVHFRAQARAQAPDVGIAQARWTVLPFTSSKLQLTPQEVIHHRTAVYSLIVHNYGSATLRYKLYCSDERSALKYRFECNRALVDMEQGIAIEPGASAELTLIAQSNRRWIGADEHHRVTVEMSSGADKQIEVVRFKQQPILPIWVVGILMPVFVLLCGGGTVMANDMFVAQPATATAIARAQEANINATSLAQAASATAAAKAEAAEVAASATAIGQAATATATWLSEDTDRDGLINKQEAQLKTLPNVRDTDEDGLDDGDERQRDTDPLKPDTDGDGLKDGDEVSRGANPLKVDTDGDETPDAIDPSILELPTIPPTPLPTATTAPPTQEPTIVLPTNTPIPPTWTPTVLSPTVTATPDARATANAVVNARATALAVPVNVQLVIEKVETIDNPDTDVKKSPEPEYYSIVKMNGERFEFEGEIRAKQEDNYNISPNWEFNKTAMLGNTMLIEIELWDSDNARNKPEYHQQMDITARDGLTLQLVIDLETCVINGSEGEGLGVCDTTLIAFGATKPRAQIKYRITVTK